MCQRYRANQINERAKTMIYSPADVQRILDEVYQRFAGRLSDGEDSLYAEILKKVVEELKKKL